MGSILSIMMMLIPILQRDLPQKLSIRLLETLSTLRLISIEKQGIIKRCLKNVKISFKLLR